MFDRLLTKHLCGVKRLAVVSAIVLGMLSSTHAQDEGGVLKVLGNLINGERKPARPAAPVPVMALQPAELVRKNVDGDFANMYSPFVSKVLTVELHFVKKVCQPNDEQFDEIHRAGRLAVAHLSKHYEDLQKIRQAASQWPKPQPQITAALETVIKETMPAEVAQRYGEELAARAAAERDASLGTMLVHIDDALLLTPKQHDDIKVELNEKWSKGWSTGVRLFMYPQYARLPETYILKPHLTDRQQSLWTQRNNNTSVNFGWQMELGVQDSFSFGVELPAFEKPKPKSEPKAGDDGTAEAPNADLPSADLPDAAASETEETTELEAQQ